MVAFLLVFPSCSLPSQADAEVIPHCLRAGCGEGRTKPACILDSELLGIKMPKMSGGFRGFSEQLEDSERPDPLPKASPLPLCPALSVSVAPSLLMIQLPLFIVCPPTRR